MASSSFLIANRAGSLCTLHAARVTFIRKDGGWAGCVRFYFSGEGQVPGRAAFRILTGPVSG
jgi:hypothetical protein